MYLLSLLLLLLFTWPAEAIVVTCGQSFGQHCDPFTGICHTGSNENLLWFVTLNGVLQEQCFADPTSCWQARFDTCTTTAPTNPNAIRHCPALADCGVGNYNPYALNPNPRPAPGKVWECTWIGGTAHLPAFVDMIDAQLCAAHFSGQINEVGDPRFAIFLHQTGPGQPREGQSIAFGELRNPKLVYEPLDPACPWVIRPASPINFCNLGMAAFLAEIKDDPIQRAGYLNFYTDQLNRMNARSWALKQGVYGAVGSSRYIMMVEETMRIAQMIEEIFAIIEDPPNRNYASIPGPQTLSPLPFVAPDSTMTQAQINAVMAYLGKVREATQHLKRYALILDNLGGAILGAGTFAAGVWAKNLALTGDSVMNLAASRYLEALALQPAALAAFPPATEPSHCRTSLERDQLLQDTVVRGTNLYPASLLHEDSEDLCTPALSSPSYISAQAPAHTAFWNSLLNYGLTARLATGGPAYQARFADVPTTHPFFMHIEAVAKAGITAGCVVLPGTPNYCPDAQVTRDQMAVFLLRGKYGPSYFPPPATGIFTDVPVTYWAAPWIERLVAEGFTAGCGSNRFCPSTAVTRDQMSIFLLKLKHGGGYVPPSPVPGTGFLDVPLTHWAAGWVKQLALEGITSGCGGGNYCPGNPVTRGQMAVFLKNTLGLQP